jgi:hypothetical protein
MMQERHHGKGHFQTAPSLENLGVVYSDLDNFVKSKELFELANEI